MVKEEIMISIPYNQKLIDRNEKRFGVNDGSQCIICSAKIKKLDNHRLWVRIISGSHIGTSDEAQHNQDADMGYYPIGADCLRNNPQIIPYVH